jgi:hypothetical protein
VLLRATNLVGASTAVTAAEDSEGSAVADSVGSAVADSVGSADCEIEGAGVADSSESELDFDQTIIATKTIPTTTANTTRLDAPCFAEGADTDLGATGVAAGAGVASGRNDVTCTVGAETRDEEVLLALFLTTRFAGAFFETFLAVLFFTARLAVVFLAVVFLAADFFATVFFAAAFFAGAFLATFFAALFFFTAT